MIPHNLIDLFQSVRRQTRGGPGHKLHYNFENHTVLPFNNTSDRRPLSTQLSMLTTAESSALVAHLNENDELRDSFTSYLMNKCLEAAGLSAGTLQEVSDSIKNKVDLAIKNLRKFLSSLIPPNASEEDKINKFLREEKI